MQRLAYGAGRLPARLGGGAWLRGRGRGGGPVVALRLLLLVLLLRLLRLLVGLLLLRLLLLLLLLKLLRLLRLQLVV